MVKRRPAGKLLVTRTVRLDPAILPVLSEHAEDHNTTEADVIRLALDSWLQGDTSTWRAKYEQERAGRIRAEKQLVRVLEAARVLQQTPAFQILVREVA